MASAPPRSVAEATAARDKLMTTLEAQDGILGGLQADFQKIAEIKRINDAIATYERTLASRKIDAAQIQQSKTDIKFAAGLRLPGFKVTVRTPSGTTVDLKTLKDANDELMKLLKGRHININKSRGIQKTSQELADDIDPQFTTADQGLKSAQARRNEILQQIGGINNEILGIKTAPANNGKYRGRSIEDLNREIDEHLQIAETLVETHGTNISIENQRKINTHLSEARNLLAAVAVALTEAEAKTAEVARASTPASAASAASAAPATPASGNATQAAQNAAVSATASTQNARVAGEEARRVAANLQRTRNDTAAANARIAQLREKLEATRQKAQAQAQAIEALPVNTTGPLNNGSSNTPRTGRAASTVQPSINTAALTAEHRKGRQAAAQGSSFSIENANNNSGRPISTSTSVPSGPILSSSSVPSGETGTGNVRHTPVYQTGTPEVRAKLNAIAAAAGLPPPPLPPPSADPDPEAERVLSEASRRAKAAAAAALAAEDAALAAADVVRSLRERPLNTTALGDLNAVRRRIDQEDAVLEGVRGRVGPLERAIASNRRRLAEVEAEIAALVTRRRGLVIPNGMNVNQQMRIQQEQVDTDTLLEQKRAEQTSLLDELEALNTQLLAIQESIAEHARRLQPLEAEEANLLGKAANVKRRKREIAAAEAAAAAAKAAAADANRQLQTISEGSNENNNASSSSSGNNNNNNSNSNASSVRSENNENNENNASSSIRSNTPSKKKNLKGLLGTYKRQLSQDQNLTRGQKKSLIPHKNPLKNLSGTNFNPRLSAPPDINSPLRNQTKPITKTKTTSTSQMTKRWRCTKPGTDLPCRTTGGTRKYRHRRRSTQKQKHKYNRKLNAGTKRVKRQRR